MAASQTLGLGARSVEMIRRVVGVAAAEGEQAAGQGQADFARHGVVVAARIARRQGLLRTTCQPALGRSTVTGHQHG